MNSKNLMAEGNQLLPLAEESDKIELIASK